MFVAEYANATHPSGWTVMRRVNRYGSAAPVHVHVAECPS